MFAGGSRIEPRPGYRLWSALRDRDPRAVRCTYLWPLRDRIMHVPLAEITDIAFQQRGRRRFVPRPANPPRA